MGSRKSYGVAASLLVTLSMMTQPGTAYGQATSDANAYAAGWMVAYTADWETLSGMYATEGMCDSPLYAFYRGWIDAWERYLRDRINGVPTSDTPPPPPPPPPPRDYSNAPRPW